MNEITQTAAPAHKKIVIVLTTFHLLLSVVAFHRLFLIFSMIGIHRCAYQHRLGCLACQATKERTQGATTLVGSLARLSLLAYPIRPDHSDGLFSVTATNRLSDRKVHVDCL